MPGGIAYFVPLSSFSSTSILTVSNLSFTKQENISSQNTTSNLTLTGGIALNVVTFGSNTFYPGITGSNDFQTFP